MLNPSQITTILTAITFILGTTAIWYNSATSWTLTFALVCIIAKVMPRYNHLLKMQLFYCLATTYIFGIIDSYVLLQCVGSKDHEGQFSAFGVFLVISTIRYYGQFQLINCFHHHELEWQSTIYPIIGFLIYHSKFYFYTNIFLIAEHIITRYVFNFSYKVSIYHILALSFTYGTSINCSFIVHGFKDSLIFYSQE